MPKGMERSREGKGTEGMERKGKEREKGGMEFRKGQSFIVRDQM